MFKTLSEWLFPGDGDGTTAPPSVTKEVGAAGLLVVAAHRDGSYTDVERDIAAAALMKLFHISNPEARVLLQEAEATLFDAPCTFVTFAAAAKDLPREDQEALIGHLWRLVATDGEELTENVLMSSVRDFLGFTRAQAEALKPVG